MPRIRQYAEKYSVDDFLAELRSRQGYHNLSRTALSMELDIPVSTLHRRLNNPDEIRVSELRCMITKLGINPRTVLLFLGYNRNQIKKSLEEESV